MKKQLLFSTLAAIMLCACGGGSNQNAGGENKAAADTITPAQIITTEDFKDSIVTAVYGLGGFGLRFKGIEKVEK